MEPTITTPHDVPQCVIDQARTIVQESYTQEERIDSARVTTTPSGDPILVVAVNRGNVGSGTIDDVYRLTRCVPTRYRVYLGHEDDRVGGMVYETDTYPDLCAIETAVPRIAIASVVQGLVGTAWVNIYD
jgi:hypothetical protein